MEEATHLIKDGSFSLHILRKRADISSLLQVPIAPAPSSKQSPGAASTALPAQLSSGAAPTLEGSVWEAPARDEPGSLLPLLS